LKVIVIVFRRFIILDAIERYLRTHQLNSALSILLSACHVKILLPELGILNLHLLEIGKFSCHWSDHVEILLLNKSLIRVSIHL
jgi:hypothetical protein